MASSYTANKAIQKPANGDFVGTWDVPINANSSIIDMALGQAQSINLAAGSVVLSTVQIQSYNLVFTGTLVGNVTVTVNSLSTNNAVVSGGFYTVQNQCANSSAFRVVMLSTVAGAQQIGIPPYEPVDILIEGTGGANVGSIKFRNLGRVGTYWDYAGSSVPAWVTDCTVPPSLNCDGTQFSSGTYPALATVLGSTTLPDARGRFRATLNQTTGRITSTGGAGSLDGNTWSAAGGAQTIAQTNLPNVSLSASGLTITTTAATNNMSVGSTLEGITAGGGAVVIPIGSFNIPGTLTGTIPLSSSGGIPIVPPSYVGGLTLIRSA